MSWFYDNLILRPYVWYDCTFWVFTRFYKEMKIEYYRYKAQKLMLKAVDSYGELMYYFNIERSKKALGKADKLQEKLNIEIARNLGEKP